MNTVTVSFKTTVRQMSKVSQGPKFKMSQIKMSQ